MNSLSPVLPTLAREAQQYKLSVRPLPYIFLFALAVAAAAIFNICINDLKTVFTTDGAHYLHSCTQVVALTLGFLQHHIPSVSAWREVISSLLLDGPLMPAFTCPVFVLLGHPPTQSDWWVAVLLLSVLHGVNTVLTAAITKRITASPMAGFLSGIFWALYPPAILAASFFVTEMPSCLLVLLTLYSISRFEDNRLWQIIAGVSAGLCMVGKPALVPGIVLSLIWVLASSNRRLATAAITATSCLLVLLSWAFFTQVATGVASITVQRLPLVNIASGWDLETDGLGSMPRTENFAILSETGSPLASVLSVWNSNPRQCSAFVLRKVTRLLIYPWNDFKRTVFGITVETQCVMQTLLLTFGLCGASFLLLARAPGLSRINRSLVVALLIMLAGHASYLLVESNARYNFTAMPLITILAACTIVTILRLQQLNSGQKRLFVISAIFALAMSTVLLNMERTSFLLNSGIAHHQMAGDLAEKHIMLSPRQHPAGNYRVLLLVDGDRGLKNCQVLVNNRPISRLELVHHIDANHYLQLNALQEYRNGLGADLDDFRQWRFATIPNETINWHGTNIISLIQHSASTIYGDTTGRSLPASDRMSYNRLCDLPAQPPYETRPPEPVQASGCPESSYVASGQRNKHRLQDQLRIRLAILADVDTKSTLTPDGQQTSCRIGVEPGQFPLLLQSKDDHGHPCLRINRFILRASDSTSATIALPKLSPTTHLSICLRGSCRAIGKPGKIGIAVALHGQNGQTQLLGTLPVFVKTTAAWREFKISDLIPSQALVGNPTSVELVIYPCPWMQAQYKVSNAASDALLKDLYLDVRAKNLPRLTPGRYWIL